MELTKAKTTKAKRDDQEALLNFGLRLKELREERGLTQLSLSFSCQVSPHYLSDVENGRRNPSLIILRRIAAAFELSLAELFDY